jgi:hypothetical protein
VNPLAKRVWLVGIVASVASVALYLSTTGNPRLPPSGRTPVGIGFGIAGTLAMIVAALYSWRRRAIRVASKPIEIDAETRKDLVAREKKALAELQSLARALMRSPKQDLREVRREAKKILKTHRVRRTIRARVEQPSGAAPRLVAERREWIGRLQTWYVWHLALGLLSVLFILLHAGFRFGSVAATVAFILLVAVVASGILGVALYWIVPPRLTRIEERAERSPEELRDEAEEVDRELAAVIEGKSARFREVCEQELSIPGISMRPSWRWLFAPAVIDRDVARPDRLRLVVKEIPPSEQEDFRKAMRLVFRKEKIEVSLYPQLRYDFLLKVWLTAHIPLSAGLAVFSVIHIAAVLYY